MALVELIIRQAEEAVIATGSLSERFGELKNMVIWIVVASLCGALFLAISWWLKAVQGRRKLQKNTALATFLLAAIAAPFLAVGGVELVNFQYPWTKGLPFVGIMCAFLLGAASPALTMVLTSGLLVRLSALAQLPGTEDPQMGDSPADGTPRRKEK
jgi:hypothetical protein